MLLKTLAVGMFSGSLLYSHGTMAAESNLSTQQQREVQQIIALFQQPKAVEIAKQIEYPLPRAAPLTDIRNAQQMQLRFYQVFDRQLMDHIAHSTLQQWSSVGWRGVMLDDGLIWLNGSKISAVNHQTAQEKQLKQQAIVQQKQHLHRSLQDFKQPVLQLITSGYVIRIDELTNGQYRYASWKKPNIAALGMNPTRLVQLEASRPDLVLKQGRLEFDGSAGNHAYLFQSGSYQYRVDRLHLGVSDADAQLTVSKNNRVLFTQVAKVL